MNRRHRLVWNHALHASMGLFNSVRPLRGSPAASARSFGCKPSPVIACALALVLALLAFGAGATPVKITGVLQGSTGTGGPNFSQSWNASSPDLGPGVSCPTCGVPLVPDTYFGADLYITSSGSIGAGAAASVTTAPVTFSATAPSLTIAKAPDNSFGNSFTVGMTSGTASFSQAAPQFSSTLGAGLSFSNSASGQICAFTCASFGGSLGSYNGSFNVLGTSTANDGTLSFFGKSVPDLNGTSIPLIIPSPGILGATNAGSIELNAPASMSGSGNLVLSSNAATKVAEISVDLGKVAASFTNNNYLAPEGNYTYDGVGFSYDVASAVLNLSEVLSQQTSILLGTDMNVYFYNANGTPLKMRLTEFAGQPTDEEIIGGTQFNPGLNISVSPWTPGADLAGDYALITGTYSLMPEQNVLLGLLGDLDLSVLSGSVSGGPLGSVGFGPVYSDDIPFDTFDNLVSDSQTFDFTESEKVYFPSNVTAVPGPPNWAFMLIGVIGIGVAEATRRRRAGWKGRRASV